MDIQRNDALDDVVSEDPTETTKEPQNENEDPSPEDYEPDTFDLVYTKGDAIKKFEASHPYNYFLTTVVPIPETHTEQLSISFQEILDVSLGDLESSLQINFMLDFQWLLEHYHCQGHEKKPLLVLYGTDYGETKLEEVQPEFPNLTAIKIEVKEYATHHSKLMVLGYKDKSMRIVVSTANLCEGNWCELSQAVWISPRCYEMEVKDDESGESVTGFRGDLIRYLNVYDQPELQTWIDRIGRTDFSAVKVFLVCSVPGHHQTQTEPLWGHLRMSHLLKKHAAQINDNCPLLVQSSSIGMLGNNFKSWSFEIATSLWRDSGTARFRRMSPFQMMFPSVNDVLSGYEGIFSGRLPYFWETHKKQQWLKEHLYLWKADQRHRTRAIPHIKTYCRYSEEEKGLYWFLHTSCNFSRSAWGSFPWDTEPGQVLRVNNYEMGVLFLPQIMINRETFPFKLDEGSESGIPIFPLVYDLPPVPYRDEDEIFVYDFSTMFLKATGVEFEKDEEVEEEEEVDEECFQKYKHLLSKERIEEFLTLWNDIQRKK